MTFQEIRAELQDYNTDQPIQETPTTSIKIADVLPHDPINLCDSEQVNYYKNETVVQRALEFLARRRLEQAVNKPNAFYISLTDKIHRNRLIIPFYDAAGKIVHYQTRTILQADEKMRPRYMSKQGSEKTLFNFNNISDSSDLFIFEGPLNACFCRNGIAVAGIQDGSQKTFTPRQQEQLQSIPWHDRIWVLDSQWLDQAALKKSKILAAQGESIFIWPEKIGKRFKDFNDVVIAGNINEISPQFILEHTHTSLTAQIMLSAM